jgi:DNA polymerase-3 subunit epsilon
MMTLEPLAKALADSLTLTRPLVCVDLEATGVWPGHDRIVQIATAKVFPDGGVSAWVSLVNPGQPIPAETTAIHGITDTMAADAPTFAELAPTIGAIMSGSDLTGYNVERFDRRLLVAEFRRADLDDPTEGARVVDAYTIFLRQEPRSLDAALRFYSIEEGLASRQAHDASSDVEATVAVLVAQLQKYPDVPRTVDGLHEWLYPRDPNRIDADGKIVWRDGVATIAFGAQAGTSLANLAATDRSFLEWVVRKDFSVEVKAVSRSRNAVAAPLDRAYASGGLVGVVIRRPVSSASAASWSSPSRLRT